MSITGLNPYATLGGARPTQGAESTAKTDMVGKADQSKNPVAEGVSSFRAAIETAEKAAVDTAVTGADPHALVQALANAEMMLDTAVTVRDKVVEAYQELLRMPV